jgi:preprotein translocase subunit Sec61beta
MLLDMNNRIQKIQIDPKIIIPAGQTSAQLIV